MNSDLKGRLAEYMAVGYLRLFAWHIVARRYRTPAGEIDIIAARGKTLSFVEVKYRPTLTAGHDSLLPHQRARIRRAALGFLQQNPRFDGYDCRFDAVLIRPWRVPYHLKNAWMGE